MKRYNPFACPTTLGRVAGLTLCLASSLSWAQETSLPTSAPTSMPSSVPASAPASNPVSITPPGLISQVDARYPPDAFSAGLEASTLLEVTIDSEGNVSEASVIESGGADFDQASLEAVRQWQFTPALQGDVPVASRIRIPFRFSLPKEETPLVIPSTKPASVPVSAPASQPTEIDGEDVIDATVRGQKKPPPRAASDFILDREILTLAPHRTAEDLLRTAPGVYVSKSEGDAVAGEVYLRGFDAEHGQDIEFMMGPVPINLPSHIHGQGYADLGFLIPEVIRTVRVTEGVYDPRQGDFAVAGSVNFDLGVEERGYQVGTSTGSFNTFRQLVLWAPKDEPEETFTAVSIKQTGGFGENRGALSGAGIGQYAFDFAGGYHALLHVSAYGARASFPGVLRLEDIEAGIVDFYDAYNDPSAKAQSAFTTRTQLALEVERGSENGGRTAFAFWFLLSDFRIRQNFTGYTERGEQNPEFIGRGDLIEQKNQNASLGARLFRRTERFFPLDGVSGNFEFGLSFRTDFIEQIQNLLQQPQNEIWDKRVDASVHGSDLGTYIDADFQLGRGFRIRGGYRADVLYYDIDDRFGNFLPQFAIEDHFLGFKRSAIGIAAGPRGTLEYSPMIGLTFLGSYGEGYRSPQARLLGEGELAPFAKVRSLETGVKYSPLGDERLELTGALYATFLSDDLAFDPGEGSLEFIGPTSRKGLALHMSARPYEWARLSLSATFVQAVLEAPPTPTAENPIPPFEEGQLLPYVPPLVVRADMGAQKRSLFSLFDQPVDGRLGLGMSFLSARPLPFGEFSDPVFLADASGSLRMKSIELGVEAFNLLNAKYAASEFAFVSDWGLDPVPSRLPERHIAAGAPLSVLGTLKLYF